jgi:hypothetical protein
MLGWLHRIFGRDSEPAEWMVATGNENGQPVIVRTRTRAPRGMTADRYPASVEIVWRFADAGMPSSEILPLLEECEDALGKLERPMNGLLRITITGCGRREWVWYVADPVSFCDQTRTLLASFGTRYPVELRPRRATP